MVDIEAEKDRREAVQLSVTVSRCQRVAGEWTHLPHTSQKPEHQQEAEVGARGERHEQSADGAPKHKPAVHALAANPRRQPTAGDLCRHVAPEEGAQNEPLGFFQPRELSVLKQIQFAHEPAVDIRCSLRRGSWWTHEPMKLHV